MSRNAIKRVKVNNRRQEGVSVLANNDSRESL